MMHIVVIALIVVVIATLAVCAVIVAANVALFVALRAKVPQRPYTSPGG